jgi:1,4-alpha-glucan branching enzyme
MSERPSVWAPFPERVELFAAGNRHPMDRDGSGWWTAGIELPPDAVAIVERAA